MDNVAVHVGEEAYNDIVEALQLAQVHLYFLPAYSPELNATVILCLIFVCYQ